MRESHGEAACLIGFGTHAGTVAARQFDAWVWFDETGPVTPLPGPHEPDEDLFPSGL